MCALGRLVNEMSGGESSWYKSNILADLFPSETMRRVCQSEKAKRGCFGLRRRCSQVFEGERGNLLRRIKEEKKKKTDFSSKFELDILKSKNRKNIKNFAVLGHVKEGNKRVFV